MKTNHLIIVRKSENTGNYTAACATLKPSRASLSEYFDLPMGEARYRAAADLLIERAGLSDRRVEVATIGSFDFVYMVLTQIDPAKQLRFYGRVYWAPSGTPEHRVRVERGNDVMFEGMGNGGGDQYLTTGYCGIESMLPKHLQGKTGSIGTRVIRELLEAKYDCVDVSRRRDL